MSISYEQLEKEGDRLYEQLEKEGDRLIKQIYEEMYKTKMLNINETNVEIVRERMRKYAQKITEEEEIDEVVVTKTQMIDENAYVIHIDL